MRKYKKGLTILLSLVLLLNIFASSYVFADANSQKIVNNEILDGVSNTNEESINDSPEEILKSNDKLNQVNSSLENDLDKKDGAILEENLTDKNSPDTNEDGPNILNNIDLTGSKPVKSYILEDLENQVMAVSSSTTQINGIDMDINDKGVVLVNEKNTAETLMKSSKYKGFLDETIFGLAGNFFLTGFESVNIKGHTHGNVMTKKLLNNTNFGSDFPNEFSYIQEKISGQNKDFVKTNDAVLVLGKDFNISPAANMWKVNGNQINSPQNNGQNNMWQDDTKKFIDLDKLQADMISLSSKFSKYKKTDGISFETDQNKLNSIGMNGVKKAIILPSNKADFYVYNTSINELGNEKIGITRFDKEDETFFLNLDAKGQDKIQLPSIVYDYNGSISKNEETSKASPGNVIVNIFDSTKIDGTFTGNIITGAENNIFLLAPKADVEISAQFNGIIIANNIQNSGTEIHRDKPTTPPTPPEPEEPTIISIPVEKRWVGSKGEDVKEVELILYADGMKVSRLTLKAPSWAGSFDNLPRYKPDNKTPIKYTIKEVKIDGYESKVTGDENKFIITNTKDSFLNIPVEKTWLVSDLDSIKDMVVEVKLLEDGVFKGKTIKLTKANNWKAEFKNLPTKGFDGKAIKYDIEEINIPGFDKGKGGNQENGFILINAKRPINPPEEYKINIPVEKTWIVEDISTIEDLVVEVKLLENDSFNGKTIKLTKANNWKAEFKNLPTKDFDGKDIVYDIEEINIPGFDNGKGGNQENGFMLINAKSPINPPEEYKINIPVQKIWENANGEEKDLKITVVLKANGIVKETVILKDPNWKHIFEKLPTKDSDGKDITYTIEEIKIDGYTTKISQVTSDPTKGFIITNTKDETPLEPMIMSVEKTWQDSNDKKLDKLVDKNGKEITEILLQVINNDTGSKIKDITLNSKNNWKIEIKDLPKIDSITGKQINYYIKEISKIDGFKLKEIIDNSTDQKYNYNLVNEEDRINNLFIDIPVEKTWIVKDIDTIKDLVVEVKLLENGVFNGKTIKLTLDNNWKAEFKNLPTKDSNSEDIIYDIEEISIPGFDKGKGGNQENGFMLINAEKPINPPERATLNIPVEKTWKVKDINTIKDLVVEVKLLENGNFNGKTINLTLDNNWKGNFNNLPTRDSKGDFIKYDIEEIDIPGFDKGKGGNQENGFMIINAERPLEPPVDPDKYFLNIPVKKLWKDKNDSIIDGDKIDKTITIRLFADDKEIQTIKLNKENWSHVFENLPKYKADGKTLIKYSLKEDSSSDYITDISGGSEIGFTVTNKAKPENPKPDKDKISIPVDKTWKDKNGNIINGNDIDRTITLRLFADGNEVQTIKLSKGNWSHVFKDLPKYKADGKTLIKYIIREDSVSGYNQTISGSSENGFTIINKAKPDRPDPKDPKPKDPKPKDPKPKDPKPKDPNPNDPYTIEWEKFNPELIDIPVEKHWVGKAASSASIDLLADGVKISSIVLNQGNNWYHEFKDLPFIDPDTHAVVNYTVEEVPMDGYKAIIDGDFNDGFIVTNTEINPDLPKPEPKHPKTDNPQTYKSGIGPTIFIIFIVTILLAVLEKSRRFLNK